MERRPTGDAFYAGFDRFSPCKGRLGPLEAGNVSMRTLCMPWKKGRPRKAAPEIVSAADQKLKLSASTNVWVPTSLITASSAVMALLAELSTST